MTGQPVNTANTLTIAIPTHDRSANLAVTLASLEPVLGIKGLRVLILYDVSDANTEQVVTEYVSRYEAVSYIRNPMSLGIEGSIARALTTPNSRYIWLLSDHMVVFPDVVRSIMPILACSDAAIGYCAIQDYGSLEGTLPREESLSSLTLREICHLLFWTSNMSAVLVKRDHVAARTREIFRFCGYTYPNLAIWSRLSHDNCTQILLLPICSRFQTSADAPTHSASYHFFRARYVDFGQAVQAMNLRVNGRAVVPGNILSEVSLFRGSAWETLSADLCKTLPEDISIKDIAEFAQIYGWRCWPFFVAALFMLMLPVSMRSSIRYFRNFVGNARRKGIRSALREYRARCLADKQIREKMRDATRSHRF